MCVGRTMGVQWEVGDMLQQTGPLGQKNVDLVFDGGGVWGIALIGALAVLEENGYTPQNIAGTSAGAIGAALVAAGYTAKEIRAIMLRENFSSFADKTWEAALPLVGLPLSVLLEAGINRGDVLLKLMRELLLAKGVRTFRDLVHPEFADQPRYRYRLQVIASDITARRMLVLPRDAGMLGLDPDDLEVAQAVRMSLSIPIFFEPIRIFNPHTKQEHLITDGAMLSSFPVFLFDADGTPEWPTFGLKLVEGNPSSDLGANFPPVTRQRGVGMVLDLISALVHTMIESHDRIYLEQDTFVRTVTIPTLGFDANNFNLTMPQMDALYQSGRDAATKFLASWDFAAYVQHFRSNAPQPNRRDQLAQQMQQSMPPIPASVVATQSEQ